MRLIVGLIPLILPFLSVQGKFVFSYNLFFYHFFSFLPFSHVNSENCILVFTRTNEVTTLKLSYNIGNELLNRVIENRVYYSYSFLYLFIFLSLQDKFVSQFSQELCKLQSINKAYIWRMNDCIVGLDSGLVLLFFHFFSIFLSCSVLHVSIENLCHSFLRN